jgi:DNA-binding CsgD family transcriptional regulator
LLESVLPHFQRALELSARLARDHEAEALTHGVLDALPAGVVIVDAALQIRFANRSARKLLDSPGAGLCCMRSGPQAGAGVHLAARAREETAALKRLVASTVSGGPGGALRVGRGDGPAIAALVSPTPSCLADDAKGPALERTAMIAMRPLVQQPSPAPDLLCNLFGLSRAESEVALALAGGASALEVASQRNVSLVTVRSQIRAILGKSESENLRHFERSMATLAALLPGGAA